MAINITIKVVSDRQFLINTAGTLKTSVYEDNQRIIPTSATLTVYRPGETTKLIDGVAMTVDANGLLSYALTATHNATVKEDYRAVIAYVYSSTTEYKTIFYDVVNSKLSKVITDEDILNELPQLRDNGWRVHGTADSGSNTTIVDGELKRYEDDYFTGGTAHSLTKNEIQTITDFVSSTGSVTTLAFSGAIATDKYILTRAYTREIQRAFEKIDELITRSGKRSALILDPYDLREVHICYSVAEICKGLTGAGGTDTFWWQMWKDYEAKAYAIFKSINFKYDESKDGLLSEAEKNKRFSTKTSGRG